MMGKIKQLTEEIETLKRDGRQLILAIESREQRGEDDKDLWRDLHVLLVDMADLHGELANAHLRRMHLALSWAFCWTFIAVIIISYTF